MDPTDPTTIRGVDSKTALYVDQQLDPIRTKQAVDDHRIGSVEKKVETLFNLYNSASRGGKVGTYGGGGTVLAGVLYALYEMFMAGGAPQ